MDSLEQRVARVTREEVSIATYDPRWRDLFEEEKKHLLSCLPSDLIRRVEHFGSTAVPGLAAKPVVDILVEVTDLEATKLRVVPVLTAQKYEYLWRPLHGDAGPPFHAWFIKRASSGIRTHHIHMAEASCEELWDGLVFRDYLVAHPEEARAYERLKSDLAVKFPTDRVAYSEGKTEFVTQRTRLAKQLRQMTSSSPQRGRS